jgi:hypothetical protein
MKVEQRTILSASSNLFFRYGKQMLFNQSSKWTGMLFLDEDTAANQINLSIYKVLLACEF